MVELNGIKNRSTPRVCVVLMRSARIRPKTWEKGEKSCYLGLLQSPANFCPIREGKNSRWLQGRIKLGNMSAMSPLGSRIRVGESTHGYLTEGP